MKVAILTLPLVLFATALSAQKDKSQRCFRVKKEKVVYSQSSKGYIDLQLGCKKPFLLSNKGGDIGSGYHFVSSIKPYTGFNYHKPIGKTTEIYGGVQLSQSKQGLEFKYEESNDKIVEKNIGTSNLVRIPIGFSYYATKTLKISIAPVLTYSEYWEVTTTGSYSMADGTSAAAYKYAWTEEDFYDQWLVALDVSAQVKVYGRWYLDAMLTMDSKTSTPLSGTTGLLYTNGTERSYSAKLNPQLFYFGIGLSYLVGTKE